MNYGWKLGRFRIKKADTVRVPDYILNCSAFVVSIASEADETEFDFECSGFFVGLFSERCKGQAFRYFVTTEHALSLDIASTMRYGVRVNRREGGIAVIPIERWYTHPSDRSADVALAPFEPNPGYIVQILGENLFRPKDDFRKLEIGIGDEVYFPGLFMLAQQESDNKNQPILRMGNIVMLPDFKIPSESGLIDAYLVEARSIGGLSGSPVFCRRTMSLLWNDGVSGESARTFHGMTGEIHLIGMMHGHWDAKESDINQVQIQPLDKKGRGVNMGIALVIPVAKIIETLNHPTLVHMREEQEDLWLKQQTPATADARKPEYIEGPEAFKRFDEGVEQILSVSHFELVKREKEYREKSLSNPKRRGPKPKSKKKIKP